MHILRSPFDSIYCKVVKRKKNFFNFHIFKKYINNWRPEKLSRMLPSITEQPSWKWKVGVFESTIHQLEITFVRFSFRFPTRYTIKHFFPYINKPFILVLIYKAIRRQICIIRLKDHYFLLKHDKLFFDNKFPAKILNYRDNRFQALIYFPLPFLRI